MPLSLEKTMDSIAKKMQIDYENLTKQIEHKGLKGRAREIVIKHFLKDYLSPFLGVESGEIISSKGDVSREIDVVIFDRLRCPVFLREDEVHIFPIESVYAVIEVKSFLDSRELEDCVEKVQSVKRMPKLAYFGEGGAIKRSFSLFGRKYEYFPTLGFVFAFDSIELGTLGQNLEAMNITGQIDLDKRIDTICVLKKGVIANFRGDKQISCTPEPESEIYCYETGKSLLLFYLLVTTVLNQAWMFPVKLTEYAQDVIF